LESRSTIRVIFEEETMPYMRHRGLIAGLICGGLGLFFPIGCTPQETPPPQTTANVRIPGTPPYNFAQPVRQITLPAELREVSGLAYLDSLHLAAVQDEQGKLFVLNAYTGAIVSETRFEKNDDYEGIEHVGDQLWILRSDGTLFEVANWQTDTPRTTKYKTALTAANDTEGLAYDAAGHRLLIACKESAGPGRKHERAIYAFDLGARQLVETPAYVLPLRLVDEAGRADDVNQVLRAFLAPVGDLSDFKPSALAVHPTTGDLYLLSSVRKVIVVLHPDGTPAALWPLPEALYRQPEGLAFAPDGTLFIASEAAGTVPFLLAITASK
jgi:uncharacterized protein YjiK